LKKDPKSDIWNFLASNGIAIATIGMGGIFLILQPLGFVGSEEFPYTTLLLITLFATSELAERMKLVKKLDSISDD